ncbi:MAG: hypothetical protein FJ368_04460 [Pelagibacterales bacterium]|nr:hypothetical protein [Pelagibacterales bacterium]
MFQLDEIAAKRFLEAKGILQYKITKVAGDASFRSYYRILNADKSFILMYAPPSHEDIKPFIKIDKFLVRNKFSAPKIFVIDHKEGFILLEDFGDDTYGKVLAKKSEIDLKTTELSLYKSAVDCLVELHKSEIPKDVSFYNEELLLREVMLFTDWYLPLKKISITEAEKQKFKNLWLEIFSHLDKKNQVLVLRDFHADNLMILPKRKFFRKVGLLDFQDAVIGSKAYDLVSLLEDARRDLVEENRNQIFQYYLEKSQSEKTSFVTDYEILSLQRNIKIIGIFARLSVRDGKHHYLNLLPRVIDLVKKRISLNSQALAEMCKFLEKFI